MSLKIAKSSAAAETVQGWTDGRRRMFEATRKLVGALTNRGLHGDLLSQPITPLVRRPLDRCGVAAHAIRSTGAGPTLQSAKVFQLNFGSSSVESTNFSCQSELSISRQNREQRRMPVSLFSRVSDQPTGNCCSASRTSCRLNPDLGGYAVRGFREVIDAAPRSVRELHESAGQISLVSGPY